MVMIFGLKAKGMNFYRHTNGALVREKGGFFYGSSNNTLWKLVLKVVIKYITLHGRYDRAQNYHFVILN